MPPISNNVLPKTPTIAVIGCGHWGKNLVRNFHQLGALTAICDANDEQLAHIGGQYRDILTSSRYESIVSNPSIDAVVIATPSHTHYALAKAALLADKHVYVEKPIATRYEEAEELEKLSQKVDKVLMVGHLLLYHPVIHRLHQLIQEGYLGKIRYIESDRLNLNPNRPDKSVLWDLGPHDLSMMMYLLNEKPVKVLSVQGSQTGDDGLVDVAHIELQFESGIRGHIHNSWVHPVKQVRLAVRGTERSAIIDDTLSWSEKLRITHNQQVEPIETPEYLNIEPLKLECQHFINCIQTNRIPQTDGVNGMEVVKLLAEAEQQMNQSESIRAAII